MRFIRHLFGSDARAARRDLERRLAAFRAEIAGARKADTSGAGSVSSNATASLEQLRDRLAEFGLEADDAELELELIDGLLQVAALRRSLEQGQPLPVVQTSHHAVVGEKCHFLASVSRPDVPGNQGGRLLITDRRIVYLGAATVTAGWAHLLEVGEQDRDLIVRRRTGQVHVFRCAVYSDVLVGAAIASHLLKSAGRG